MVALSQLYTSHDARRLVGISQRQLTYWDQSALVRPHARAAAGRGSRRLYTVLDVVQLKVIRRLREAGMSLQKIRRAFVFIAALPDEPAPLAELAVLTDGQRIFVRRSDEAVVDALSGQLVLWLPLADVLAEVLSAMVPSPYERGVGRSSAILIGGQRP